ncbi:MAG: TldD/PmbA family protein, partial [Candidatus Bathyarchaeota archaeon]
MEHTVDRIIELSEKFNPDQVEAYGSRNRLITIRLANNEVLEAKSLAIKGVGIRFVLNKSIGLTSSTDLSEEGLKNALEKAFKIAKSKKSDPDFKSLPEPKKAEDLAIGHDKDLLNLEAEETVKWGKSVIETAKGINAELDISGSINIVVDECWIRNSLGVDCSDINTFIFSSITAEKGDEISGVGQTCSKSLKDFDPMKAGSEAAQIQLKDIKGEKIIPDKYEVIMGPFAVAELMEFVVSYAVNLAAIDAGISYFKGRLGEVVASQKFTLTDDGRSKEGIASKKYDDEGIPTGRVELIKEGILKNFLSDSYYANKLSSPVKELSPTGNGFRYGEIPCRSYTAFPSIQPTNLLVDPGKSCVDDLIANTKKGILIGRIWYTYPLNPTVGDFSATNRGSTFYIENGKLKHPILPNSFRINDNIQKLINNIMEISSEQVQSMVWGDP